MFFATSLVFSPQITASYKDISDHLKFIAERGRGGEGVPLLYVRIRICAFEIIGIQFPQDIQLHVENCCIMRKNSSNNCGLGTFHCQLRRLFQYILHILYFLFLPILICYQFFFVLCLFCKFKSRGK